MKRYFLLAIIPLMIACKNNGNDTTDTDNAATAVNIPENIPYQVINIFPHDRTSFTEGFFLYDGKVYESTGEHGKSKLLVYELKTGKVVQSVILPEQYFGEGISIIKDKLYQLTYKEHKVFVYDLKTLHKIKEFSWPYEGWGMTTDDSSLIISTGSSNLYYVNPEDFSVIKTVGVSNNYGPLAMINELEYVDGFIYANVWQTDNIVKIDPHSGKVVQITDLTGIRAKNGIASTGDVLNGIAYNKADTTFLVTGKNWENIFEIRFN